MTRYSTARVSKRLTDQIAVCLRARYGANLTCHDLKVENKPGAGAEIALCAPGERHSDCVEVVDEDGEVIELDRADRKDVGNAEVNAPSHGQRKGGIPERELVIADYGDQQGTIELQPLPGSAGEKMPERPEPGPVF